MPAEVIKFAEFELDLGRYELRRQGQAVKLEKVPMELLILLAGKGGQLVTRDEIIHKLWGDNVFVDARQGINTAISKIRLALKDDPDQPRILQTVFGKGYRLVAPIERANPRQDEAKTTPSPQPTLKDATDLRAAEGSAADDKFGLAGTRKFVTRASLPWLAENEMHGQDARGTSPTNQHDLMKPATARALFLLIQFGYLVMYGAAFTYFQQIQRLGAPHLVPQATLLFGLVGAAVRLYLISAVGFNYPGSGQLFRRAFPGILILDVAWAAAPLLLFHKWGEVTLLFVAALAFLPFSQRTLMSCAYHPASKPRAGN